MVGLENRIRDTVLSLHKIGALKFGSFKVKVGIDSPVYFDLRNVVTHPKLMNDIAMLLWDFAQEDGKCDQLCGVPYAALPIATLISVEADIPMVIRRKEAKKYGTKKLIEGRFNPGEKCVVIEDVVTSGSSILETVNDLQAEGLDVTCALVIVDREQGGKTNLAEKGIKMRSLCTLSQMSFYIDIQGFYAAASKDFIAKEIAIVCETGSLCHLLIQPPVGIKADCGIRYYLENFFHGLTYSEGFVPYYIMINKILNILSDAGLIDQDMVDSVKKYLAASQIRPDGTFLVPQTQKASAVPNRLAMSYGARAKEAVNPVAAKLLKIMETKKSNLCVAADFTTMSELVNLAKQIASHVCIFKTHIDIVTDFKLDVLQELCQLAKQHNFLIMEDRKFADIGNTVRLQFKEGPFRISSWADIVTVHPVPGEGIITGLKSSLNDLQCGCFLVAEMSSSGNLNTPNYVASCMEMTEKNKDFVVGVVCQTPSLIHSPGQIQLTPGVKLDSKSDGNLGQQYNSPEEVILSRGADVAVVGRGITQAEDPVQAAEEYRSKLWAAYLKRIGVS